jgi:cell division protein FtsN
VTTEDHDSRISDLYRQSSQETPPAHIDRAVLVMARKSVRRRLLSPFGNHWVAGGALAGVVVLSVLLIPDVPRQPDHYAPVQDALPPSSETLPEVRKETAQNRVLPSELPAESKLKRDAPLAPKPRFDFYGDLPDSEVVAPQAEPRARLQQAPAMAAEDSARITPAPAVAAEESAGTTTAPAVAAEESAGTTTAPAVAAEESASTTTAPAVAAEESAGTTTAPAVAVEESAGTTTAPAVVVEKPARTTPAPAGSWYLQVGSFREQSRADKLQAKLTGLGYKCEVHEVRVTGTDVYHRVRVGPFTDNDALEKSKQKLGTAGIGAYAVRVEE